jgi:hypothetical protein
MKWLAAAALALAFALPVCAQRGSGHAGFGGHSASAVRPAPSFHGGFAPSQRSFAPAAPFRYTGGTLAHAPVSYPSSMRMVAPGVRYPMTAPANRPNFYHHGHGDRPPHNGIRSYPVYPYVYSSYVYGYLPPDLLDDSFDNGDLSQQAQPEPQPDLGYSQQPAQPEYGYPQPAPQPEYGNPYPQSMPSYPAYPEPQPAPESAYAYPEAPPAYPPRAPQPTPAAPQMHYVPGSADTVTLIFKDGRPPEQIKNYLATKKTLTIIDGNRHREIPIADLDVAATIQANRETGVGFQLPAATP